MFSKKPFIIGMLIGLCLLVAYITTLPDGRLHIVFCDVGQGDAAYIRTPDNQDMVIDGGPDDKVLSCLGRHMPFYDRTIDVVMMTHPQKDHLQGLISIAKRYTVNYFIIGVEGNDTGGYRELIEVIKNKQIPIKHLYRGDQFSLGDVTFDILWPEKSFVASHISPPISDLGNLSNVKVLGLQTSTGLNDFSYYVDLHYGSFQALFTGDGDRQIQPLIEALGNLPDVDVLKFPHHGSKTGVTSGFLDAIKPELAVISVGKNSYGHPTKEALQQLSDRNIKTERTDQVGDVEVVSDGNGWEINSEKK